MMWLLARERFLWVLDHIGPGGALCGVAQRRASERSNGASTRVEVKGP